MDAFVHGQLLWKIEMMLGRQQCLNWEIFMVIFPQLPLPYLNFGCLSSSLHGNLHSPRRLSTTVYNYVQMHKDGCSGKCLPVFWDSTRGRRSNHYYCSTSFSLERSLCLGKIGRQYCCSKAVSSLKHINSGSSREKHNLTFIWDVGL